MIRITNELSIPENEITFTASRSGGPGGQNVNKVSSRVTLSFDVWGSTALSEEQKRKIASKLATRINKDGVLRIISQRTRSQEMNRGDALERFVDLVNRALIPERRRIKTRTPAGAKERRMEEKKKRTRVKEARSKKGWDS
ncbi:MAG TPA: alternative ribosome rescue aminoacyl-tRNA hydrolase ArfB [Terriglobia bacterium]|nr:alternative ribosome rescue aminoacyl-tRNA hydrolase ArfB [Terriglobia bacterium]